MSFWRYQVLRRILLCLCLVAFPAVLAAAPVRIGLSLSLEGKYREMGRQQQLGYRLWQQQLNSRGGLLGRKVELVVRDDESLPETAAAIYRELLDRERVDLVFSPYSSAITAAVAEVVDRRGCPMIAAGASADTIWTQGYAYLFGLYTPANRYAIGFLELLVRHDVAEIAIIGADDTFSRSIAEGSRVWAERFGISVSHFQFFPKGTSDLRSIVAAAQQTGAQGLLVCGHLQESVDVRRALQQQGWQPKAFYASVGPVLHAFGEELGQLSELTFSSSQWEAASAAKFPGGKRFLTDFLKSYGSLPSYQAASAYAAGQILEKAVSRSGGIEREQLRRTLLNMDTMTILGRYGVDKSGLQIRHFPLIIQWQGGRKEVVWPEEFSTSEPMFKPGATP